MITEAAVKCPPIERAKRLALVSVNSFTNCVHILKLARKTFRGSLSAFEFMDRECMAIMDKAFGVQMPFTEMKENFYLLVEVLDREDDDSCTDTKLLSFLESCGDLIEDGVVP